MHGQRNIKKRKYSCFGFDPEPTRPNLLIGDL